MDSTNDGFPGPTDLLAQSIDAMEPVLVGPGCVRRDLASRPGVRVWSVDIAPGAAWPWTDRHDAAGEDIFVVAGELIEDDRRFGPGAYLHFAPHSRHRPRSEVGVRLVGFNLVRGLGPERATAPAAPRSGDASQALDVEDEGLRRTTDAEAADDAFWDRERRFWTEGAAFLVANVHSAAVMVFPPPAGILSGADIAASLQGAPRWASLVIEHGSVHRPGPDVVMLAYQGRAHRPGAAAYVANCSSGYLRTAAGWRLFMHQQTPLGIAPEGPET